jgi:hypothetical protein
MVRQLAAIAGIELTIQFGQSGVPGTDCVSVNAAATGSLVNSRTADPWPLTPPIVRPDALLHFAVPRVQPTVTDTDVVADYQRIMLALEDPGTQRDALEAIRNADHVTDDPAIMAYVDRIRGWLDFLARADYNPDRLLITLDDNRPGPLSDGLKLLFGRYSHYVMDGTDEGMMLLLARALGEKRERMPTTIGIVFTAPGDLVSAQPLESGMMIENVLHMTGWLGLRISPNIDYYEDWRPVLWIHGAGNLSLDVENTIRETSSALGDRPVIVADVAKVNGGDELLIDVWRGGSTPSGLTGYLAWNTCSNTLGSAVALWASIDFAYEHTSDPEGVRAGVETFLWSRFLDDYFYQRLVRTEISNIVRSEGGDPYHLTDEEASSLSPLIAERIREMWVERGEQVALPLRMVDPMDDTGFVVELPWNRLFEIELFVDDARGILPTISPFHQN